MYYNVVEIINGSDKLNSGFGGIVEIGNLIRPETPIWETNNSTS